jgi:nicotinamidase/pyrazinamidase
MEKTSRVLQKGDALLVVDVQKDFCPGGRLPVAEGDLVVPVLNRWLEAARRQDIPVYASRDWHPRRHPSFREEGGLWPPHCLQDSDGAAFHPDLNLPTEVILVTKGVRFDQDQNSAFEQTGLGDQMRRDGIRRLWIGGLAEDVCILATVLDALQEGFQVRLLAGATRPVTAEGGRQALEKMQRAGAQILD